MDNEPQIGNSSSFFQKETHTLMIDNSQNPSVIEICQAYNETFVILEQIGRKNITEAHHIDFNGVSIKTLNIGKYESNSRYSRMKMMTDDCVIIEIYEYGNFWIVQWNLETNTHIRIRCGDTFYNKVFLFGQTNLICIVEKKNYGQPDILGSQSKMYTTVKYFQFPLISSEDLPIHTLANDETKFLTYYDESYKVNNHSGIAWAKFKHLDSYKIKYLDYSLIYLLDLREGLDIRKFQFDMSFAPDPKIFETFVTDVWQVGQSLYIKYKTELNQHKFFRQNKWYNISEIEAKSVLENERVNQFIWDFKNKTVRPPKFAIKSLELKNDHFVQFSSGLRPATTKTTITFLLKKLMNPLKQSVEVSSWDYSIDTIYVNAQTEDIIYVEKGAQNFQPSLRSYIFPEYDKSSFMEISKDYDKIRQNNEKQEYKLSFFRIKLVDAKMMAAFFIQGLIANCDEDLIYYVGELLEDGKKGSLSLLQIGKKSLTVKNEGLLTKSWRVVSNIFLIFKRKEVQ